MKRALLRMVLAGGPVVANAATPQFTTLYAFTGGTTNSETPGTGFASDASGNLYGISSYGGSGHYPSKTDAPYGNGTVFQLSKSGSSWSYKLLHSFQGGSDGYFDSAGEAGSLVSDGSGSFYGTVMFGGTSNSTACHLSGATYPGCGVVFEISPPAAGQTSWTEHVIWSFTGNSDGAYPAPRSRLTRDSTGALWGIAAYGGSEGAGTVFKLTPPAAGQTKWTEETIYNFPATAGPPIGNLLILPNNDVVGVTSVRPGTVYVLTPSVGGTGRWKYATIFTPNGSTQGLFTTGVTLGPNGSILVTTETEGTKFYLGGTVVQLSPLHGNIYAHKLLWSFGTGGDCCGPQSPLLVDSTGSIYGTSGYLYNGGSPAYGAIWKLSPPASGTGPWKRKVLYTFNGSGDGGGPGALLADPSGNLFGLTYYNTAFDLTGSGFRP